MLKDGDEKLRNRENPAVLPELHFQSLTPINTMGGYKKRQQRNKTTKTYV